MEQTQKEKLSAKIALLEKALATLREILARPEDAIIRDASIQRFEYTFELAWKSIRLALVYTGTPCNSPREAIKGAFKMGWLQVPDQWLEVMESRNLTSHTYDSGTAESVYAVARTFPALLDPLLIALKQL